jgi:hypothetical protein
LTDRPSNGGAQALTVESGDSLLTIVSEPALPGDCFGRLEGRCEKTRAVESDPSTAAGTIS